VRSAPAIANLSGDDSLEIVFGSDDGGVYAYNYLGNQLWVFETLGEVRSAPTIADVDADGVNEVIVGSEEGTLYVIKNDGLLLWSFNANGSIVSSPLVHDFDDTPQPEIVFGSVDGNVYALNHKGELKWTYRTPDAVKSSASVGDTNRDGEDEVIVGGDENIVYILFYPPYMVWQYQMDADISGAPVVADYDLDGRKEILFSGEDGVVYTLYYHTYAGDQPNLRVCEFETDAPSCTRQVYRYTTFSAEWNYSTGDGMQGSLIVADLDGESKDETVIATEEGNVIILNNTGGRILNYHVSEGIYASPSAADFDGDGSKEIVFGSDDKKVYVINDDGMTKWLHTVGSRVRSSPAIADLDGDGSLEFAVGADDGRIYVFGDIVSFKTALGEHYLAKAKESYEASAQTAADEFIAKAKEVFSQLGGDGAGLNVEEFEKRIRADRLIADAQNYFNESKYVNASETVHKALLLYDNISNTEGIRSGEAMLIKVRVAHLLDEAEQYYLIDFFNDSRLMAHRARNLSIKYNYPTGVNDSEALMKRTERHERADELYFNALSSYYNESYADRVYNMLAEARKIYAALSDETGVNASDTLYNVIEADRNFDLAFASFNNTEYELAITLAYNASDLYKSLDDSSGVAKCLDLVNRSVAYVKADNYMVDAQSFFIATDFISAASLAENAFEAYTVAGDLEKAGKAQLLMEKSTKAYKAKHGGVPIDTATAAVGVVLIVVLSLRLRRIRHDLIQRAREKGEPDPPVIPAGYVAGWIIKQIRREKISKLESAGEKPPPPTSEPAGHDSIADLIAKQRSLQKEKKTAKAKEPKEVEQEAEAVEEPAEAEEAESEEVVEAEPEEEGGEETLKPEAPAEDEVKEVEPHREQVVELKSPSLQKVEEPAELKADKMFLARKIADIIKKEKPKKKRK